MTSVWEQVIGNAKLISLPEAYLNLKKVLDQDDFSMAEVAVAINNDPALTARLLRLVNSPFYGYSGSIDTVFRAVTILGTQQVHSLALATSVSQAFEGMDNQVIDMSSFWSHSVFCGIAAKNLAKACNIANSESLFVAGLLHDIGHLVMYQTIPELCQQAIVQAKEAEQPLYLVEREMIELDYARVAGALMRQWLLPVSLRETVEFHIEPEQSMDFQLETYVLHIAAQMAIASGNDDETVDDIALDGNALENIGLSMKQCIAIQQSSSNDLMKVVSSIFPVKKAV